MCVTNKNTKLWNIVFSYIIDSKKNYEKDIFWSFIFNDFNFIFMSAKARY